MRPPHRSWSSAELCTARPMRRSATAFSGRTAGHTFNITGITADADGFDAEREWVRRFWRDLEPHGSNCPRRDAQT